MMPVLHDFWRSSACYRVRIGLGLKGIAWRAVPVDLTQGAQRGAAHLAVNPQGVVPALQIDGLVLTQSLAILEYLDETRPAPPLLPPDTAGRARVRAIALAIACDIHPLSNLSVLDRVAALGGEAARTEWNLGNLARGMAAVEALLDHPATGRFVHGDAPGLADVLLVPQLYNLRRWGAPLDRFPRALAIEAECTALPAFAAALPEAVRPD